MRLPVVLLALLLCGASQAQDFKTRLQVAPTKQAIREFCSQFRKFGQIRESEYQAADTRLFMCWAEHKGSPSFLFGYVLRAAKWHLIIDHPEDVTLAGAQVVVSVADNTVRLLSKEGSTLKTYSLVAPLDEPD